MPAAGSLRRSVDVVVVGAGAAGVAAAICAARAGASTLIVDRHAGAGGTGGLSGITTLCGLLNGDGEYLNDGLSREFAQELMAADRVTESTRLGRVRVIVYRPASFREVARRLLEAEPRIRTLWGTDLGPIGLQAGRIHRVLGTVTGAVIDCTGVAAVGRAVGERVLRTDETTQAPAVHVHLADVERTPETPAETIRLLLAARRFGLPPIGIMPSVPARQAVVKLEGPMSKVPELVTFLRDRVPGFERCRLTDANPEPWRRSGAMIAGQHLLTGGDVLGARKFPDAVARACWPIEQWDADGNQIVRHPPEGDYYEIPADSLRAARTENLFMAGKSLSADVDAIASARVIGCCLATGAAAGAMATDAL